MGRLSRLKATNPALRQHLGGSQTLRTWQECSRKADCRDRALHECLGVLSAYLKSKLIILMVVYDQDMVQTALHRAQGRPSSDLLDCHFTSLHSPHLPQNTGFPLLRVSTLS